MWGKCVIYKMWSQRILIFFFTSSYYLTSQSFSIRCDADGFCSHVAFFISAQWTMVAIFTLPCINRECKLVGQQGVTTAVSWLFNAILRPVSQGKQFISPTGSESELRPQTMCSIAYTSHYLFCLVTSSQLCRQPKQKSGLLWVVTTPRHPINCCGHLHDSPSQDLIRS